MAAEKDAEDAAVREPGPGNLMQRQLRKKDIGEAEMAAEKEADGRSLPLNGAIEKLQVLEEHITSSIQFLYNYKLQELQNLTSSTTSTVTVSLDAAGCVHKVAAVEDAMSTTAVAQWCRFSLRRDKSVLLLDF